MNESLSGNGAVVVKATGELVGRCAYWLKVHRPRVVAHGDLEVELDVNAARRHWFARTLLTLRVEDGRTQDFYVSGVSGDDNVTVIAAGGLSAKDG